MITAYFAIGWFHLISCSEYYAPDLKKDYGELKKVQKQEAVVCQLLQAPRPDQEIKVMNANITFIVRLQYQDLASQNTLPFTFMRMERGFAWDAY